MKRLILLLTLAAVLPPTGSACTGISLTAHDGSYVQARTIEWAQGPLDSYYTVIPRGERLRSDTPQGESQGLTFTARYGVVGLAVVKPGSVVHWRIGDASGRQVVLELTDDVPRFFENTVGVLTSVPDIPSATQWTSAIDLSARHVYYHTAYNSALRCIDLRRIDFTKVKRQSHPLDRVQEQPVEMVEIK